MTTDASDDNVVELTWDRLAGWVAGLCRRDKDNRCLPAALWLVCWWPAPGRRAGASPLAVRGIKGPVGSPLQPAPSETEALADLISELQEGIPRLGLGQARNQPGKSQGPPLSWSIMAQSLKEILRTEPDRFRPCLWLTINFLRHYRSDLELDEPTEPEIGALLDDLDLYHPALMPAVQRMTSSVPGAREALTARLANAGSGR